MSAPATFIEGSRFKCGCETWTGMHLGAKVFFYRPCASPGCIVRPIVLEESEKLGNPILVVRTRPTM